MEKKPLVLISIFFSWDSLLIAIAQ